MSKTFGIGPLLLIEGLWWGFMCVLFFRDDLLLALAMYPVWRVVCLFTFYVIAKDLVEREG